MTFAPSKYIPKFLLCFSVIALLFTLNSCSALFPPNTYETAVGELGRSIDSILSDSIFIPTHVGIKIVSLTNRRVLYERDSKALFHPASNLKLLTTGTALYALGKDYKFRTALYADSLTNDGSVLGNLYFKGFGNPDLTLRDLTWMVEQLKGRGMKEVRGDLVGDVSFFDDLYWGKGWMWDDEPSPYEAFISPLTVNDNSVKVTVTPGEKVGQPVHVRTAPKTKYVPIVNLAMTSPGTVEDTLMVTRDFRERSNAITVKGALPMTAKQQEFTLSVWRPELYCLSLLQEELDREGISVRGVLRLGMLAKSARLLALHEWPIDSVIVHINKSSDNLSAENTLKVIAAEKRGIPGTSMNGISVENEFLSSMGIDTASYLIADGSGVSHYDLLNAETIVLFLTAMVNQKDNFNLFYDSLPVAGMDGTLEHRMRGTVAEGNVRAKTGTTSGVSSLSGYVRSAEGELLAFSIMMQDFIGSPKPYRDAQDKITELLVRFKR